MRVLFSTTAGAGHFGPLVPVARACAAAGHEVRVAAPASFADDVARAGLAHEPFDDVPGPLMEAVFRELPGLPEDEANRRVLQEVFGRLDAQQALPGVRRVIGSWRPDVVVREPIELGSLAAAVADGVPHAQVSIGVTRMLRWAESLLGEPLSELDAAAGLSAGTLAAALAGETICTSVPPGLDGHDPAGQRVVRYRVPGAAPTGTLPAAWGDADAPLVYVTFGSVAGNLGHLGHVYGAALAALAEAPVRVLLTTGRGVDPDLLRPWPTNSHVAQWWPQDEVMPLSAVCVGHGGFGTTMAAVAAGVPQVVVPLFASDQRLNAGRVHDVGAGVGLFGGAAELGGLGDAVAQVLAGDSYRDVALGLAAEVAALPDVSVVVDAIEQAATGRA
ncbi:glycosyltransferase [Intrasporangium sp. YIM S08009]|uniref:glycosyltransferase n=1 Tax=Intrasporangium zincisolvens TaxID=3080018 RepID=UPI002B05D937|nr:glycosyltransferase [Intrasporangium sp. YIM S08009]